MDHHLFEHLILLLFISCGVATLAEKLKQPYSTALVLVGLVVSVFKLTPELSISHDVIFSIVLPPLLFYGAMHMDLEQLKINWKPIALLAIPGVVCSTFLIGFLLNKLIGLDLIYALLFGALITPTDPISVLSILKRVGAPERLRVILEGESIFNDGTGVVVFAIIFGIVTGSGNFTLGGAFVKFLFAAGGGTIVGLIVGFLAFKLLKEMNNPMHEVAVTVVLTFGTPALAEKLHFSGIIAVVVAGLIIGNFGRHYSMSEKTRKTIDHFWETIDFLITSLLFMVIGIELQVINKASLIELWKPIGLSIVVLLVSRVVVVYPIVWIKNKISANDIPWAWSHVLFWGGLKGSLSIALVVGLPADFPHRNLFLTLAFSIVLFSLVFQALTMKPMLRILKLSDHD